MREAWYTETKSRDRDIPIQSNAVSVEISRVPLC